MSLVEEMICEHPAATIGGAMALFLVMGGAAAAFFGFNVGDNYYTGYIYASETAWGRTIGHIRLGEAAGEDTQPEFCVYGREADKTRELAGSGKKVRVHVKPTALHFKGLFGCSAETEVEIL